MTDSLQVALDTVSAHGWQRGTLWGGIALNGLTWAVGIAGACLAVVLFAWCWESFWSWYDTTPVGKWLNGS